MAVQFQFGDAVKISEMAPSRYHRRAKVASVCGFDEVATLERSKEFGVPIGASIVLLEAPCGNSLEVPEIFLRHM